MTPDNAKAYLFLLSKSMTPDNAKAYLFETSEQDYDSRQRKGLFV